MIFLGIVLLADSGYGQEFYIGVKLGLSRQSPKSGDADFEYKVDTRTIYGFRLGLRASQFALEGVYSTADHFLDPKSDAPEELERERFKFSNFGLNALYFIPIPLVEPYLTIGYGSYRAVISDLAKDTSGGLNAGVGAMAKMGRYVSVAAEARYHSVSFEFNDRKVDVSDWVWNVSFNFHFNFMDRF
jgi:hypothetical protein